MNLRKGAPFTIETQIDGKLSPAEDQSPKDSSRKRYVSIDYRAFSQTPKGLLDPGAVLCTAGGSPGLLQPHTAELRHSKVFGVTSRQATRGGRPQAGLTRNLGTTSLASQR